MQSRNANTIVELSTERKILHSASVLIARIGAFYGVLVVYYLFALFRETKRKEH